MKKLLFKKILLAGLVILSTESVFATGFVLPGYERTSTSNFTTWATSDTLALIAVQDNSYYCRAIPPTGAESVQFASTMTSHPGTTAPTVTQLGGADGGNSSTPGIAFSFTANTTGTHIISVSAVAGNARAIFTCHNTTLFGSFNTVNAANPVNFLEITNISTVTSNVTVIIKNFSGVEIARFVETVSPGQRRDVGLHDKVGVANTFGSVQLVYDSPAGSITADISKYNYDANSNLNITATVNFRARLSL